MFARDISIPIATMSLTGEWLLKFIDPHSSTRSAFSIAAYPVWLCYTKSCVQSEELDLPGHARIQEFSSGWGRGGGPGQSDKKALTTCFFLFFFSFFLSSAYFTEVKWSRSISKKYIIFQGSRGGPTFSRGGGGVQLFPGGSNSYRNPYNL